VFNKSQTNPNHNVKMTMIQKHHFKKPVLMEFRLNLMFLKEMFRIIEK